MRSSFGDERRKRFVDIRIVEPEGRAGPPAEPPVEPDAQWLSDDFLAERLSAQLGDDWLYCEAMRRWLYWEGHRWVYEPTRQAADMARKVCRREAKEVSDRRLARSVDSEPAVRRAERLATALRRHAVRSEQFDRDLWLLNTPEHVINLRGQGQELPHRRDFFMTKSTSVSPAPDGCPLWQKFIFEACGDDAEVVQFLQRAFGYALTGVTTEHAVIILHGAAGGEGKSVILSTIAGILADYTAVAPEDMLTVARGERHSTDLAGLRGARLVIASEIEPGREWAEARLKAISGGDAITARFMRADFFTFQPQFTLVIATNHLPRLKSPGGMRRRLYVVPFRSPPKVPDPELPDKLKAEWPAILAWLIDGMVAWHKGGLRAPAAIVAATDEYIISENAVARWVAECCDRPPGGPLVPTKALHADYTSWAQACGETMWSERKFSQHLAAAGVVHGSSGVAKGFRGIRVKGPAKGLDLG